MKNTKIKIKLRDNRKGVSTEDRLSQTESIMATLVNKIKEDHGGNETAGTVNEGKDPVKAPYLIRLSVIEVPEEKGLKPMTIVMSIGSGRGRKRK